MIFVSVTNIQLSKSSLHYANGVIDNRIVGWVGNGTGKLASELLEDILQIRNPEDLVSSFRANYKIDRRSKKKLKQWVATGEDLTRLKVDIFPFGRCLAMKLPKRLDYAQVVSIQIQPNSFFYFNEQQPGVATGFF